MTYVQQLDASISSFLSSLLPHTPFFDRIFTFLSISYDVVFIWVVMGIILAQWRHFRSFRFWGVLALCVGLSYVVTVHILKPLIARDRPYVAQNIDTLYCPQDFSFPSGHATGAFAAAMVFATYDPKRKWFYFAAATVISYSRIYLYCHYFFDVVAGAALGMAIAWVLLTRVNGLNNPHITAPEKESTSIKK